MNVRLEPIDQLRHERMVAEARTAMGDAAFDAGSAGTRMTTPEVIALALGAIEMPQECGIPRIADEHTTNVPALKPLANQCALVLRESRQRA